MFLGVKSFIFVVYEFLVAKYEINKHFDRNLKIIPHNHCLLQLINETGLMLKNKICYYLDTR